MFTTDIRSQSPCNFDAWRLLDEKKKKERKKRKEEKEKQQFVLCEKEPLHFTRPRSIIMKRITYYISSEGRYMLNIATVPSIA